MYDNETKDQFVELRAAGKSFGDISTQLGIAKSTLHRWEDERKADIARLRRIQWEEFEAQVGFRLEDRLTDVGCSISDYEMRLGHFNLNHLSLRDTVMLLRESRREYFRLRALLVGTGKTSGKSNKTERFSENAETNTRNINDLQQPKLASFDFPSSGGASRGRSLGENNSSTLEPQTSSQPSESPNPQPADAVHVSPCLRGQNCSPESNKTERPQENGTTESRNINSLQQPKPESFDSSDQSKIANPQSKIDDDFLGSIVINPLECGAGIVQKWLEHEAAHNARRNGAPG